MKLNFWQWIGLIVLVIAVAYWVYEKSAGRNPTPAGTAPVVQPTR